MFSGYEDIYIGGRGAPWEPEGDHEGGERAPALVAASLTSRRVLQVFFVDIIPKITLPEVSFRLDSV